MINEIKFQFDSAQDAARFLNTLTPWSEAPVKAKLFQSDSNVIVSYEHDAGDFDYTCSKLDDLASSMGGSEI